MSCEMSVKWAVESAVYRMSSRMAAAVINSNFRMGNRMNCGMAVK